MSFVPGQTVGIDLGTSFSAVSQLDADGNPVVIRNSQGKLISASVVVLGQGQNVYVNPSKPLGSYSDAQGVITAIKRQMGNSLYYVMYEGRRINPEFISSLILRRVKLDAEQEIGPIANAVITVPYYFNDLCRRATRNAGKIAGLNVVDLLNEPTAATLAYAWMNNELGHANLKAPEKKILVYDLGGGTFDVTVVRYTPTNFRVMATDGDTLLGGMEWTERIVNYVSDRFKEKYGIDPRSTTASLLNLRAECDQAKQELSQRTQTLIQVNLEGRTIMVGLTRPEFERMTADLLQRTRDTTELVLEQSNIRPGDLDEVLLVGGSTYMPAVIQMLREVCGREPSAALAPQLAVAQGAAIHAAILEARERGEVSRMGQLVLKRLRSVRTVDVNSHSLGVEIADPRIPDLKRNHIMIPRNQMLPYSIKQRFVTTKSNPDGILIRLLEGEASDVAACTFIGECRIEGLPRGLPEGSPVEVTYAYDAERRIRVSARELTTRAAAEVVLQKEGELDPTVIEAFQALARQYQAE